jgi:hypothetical protein
MGPFSISTDEKSKVAAAAATDNPPGPALITQISGLSSLLSCTISPPNSPQLRRMLAKSIRARA